MGDFDARGERWAGIPDFRWCARARSVRNVVDWTGGADVCDPQETDERNTGRLTNNFSSRLGFKARQAFLDEPNFLPSSSRASRSEEHTSELQSRLHLVCRLLLEKK